MLSDDQHVFERLRTDFATPAEELAAWNDGYATAEQIETYRERVGDIWLDERSETKEAGAKAALDTWMRGESGFAAMAEALNEIYE